MWSVTPSTLSRPTARRCGGPPAGFRWTRRPASAASSASPMCRKTMQLWCRTRTMPDLLAPEDLPALTADQMRAVDRAMIEDLHIDLVQMMENAGRNLAELAIRLFSPTTCVVLAGPGGNGGGGLAAARHLTNRGVR